MSFKVGDEVLIVSSFGGGLPFVGQRAIVVDNFTPLPSQSSASKCNCMVILSGGLGQIVAEAVPLTPLLEALC